MKNGKKPTKRQAMFLQQHGYNPYDWLVVKDTSTEMWIVAKEKRLLISISKRKEE